MEELKISKIYIGNDHAGLGVKYKVLEILKKLNLTHENLGTNSNTSVDYPDIANKVCEKLSNSSQNYGILICGSGTGMSIAANRHKHIRASLCYDTYSAKMSREDNNANILCLRAREFDENKYEEIIKTFFSSTFTNKERHKIRLDKLK